MKFVFFSFIILLIACNATNRITTKTTTQNLPQNISLNGKLFTALYQQRAAEYRALCLQSYNIAKLRISNYKPNSSKPLAIITDIDETILDNSPYAVNQAFTGKEYTSESWYNWTSKSLADTMPGAAAFLQYVASKNVQIFYITNREDKEKIATLKNLQKFNLPNADSIHLFTKSTTSSKEQRRQSVINNYDIILLMGDNLADLSKEFDKKSETERSKNVDKLADEFGNRFIVFPNANYGDWESSLYKYDYNLLQLQKDSVIKNVLKSY